MRKIFTLKLSVFLLLLLTSFFTYSQTITTPRTPSPAANIMQTIGISTIGVHYSRPSVKGRTVWGNLVPYGWNVEPFGTGKVAPWRAGANENTVISFSHTAMVEGKVVPAGSYGLFFVINKDNTGELILSKDYQSWGNFFYDAANDQFRTNIQIRSVPHTELLTYDFINITKNSAELILNWEKKQFPVKIEFAVDDIVMANAATELKGLMGFTWQGFSSAAVYSLQNNVNLEQGLQWIDKAITMNTSFTTLQTKSNILAAMGKKEEADKIMNDGLKRATEVEINAYGYQLLGLGNLDKAIEVFMLNTNRFPNSPNAWDSMGEAYFTKGDKKNATASFKKSLSLNPAANVKANSEKFLEKLGAK